MRARRETRRCDRRPDVQALEPRTLFSVTPSFVEVPISAAAIAADPTLVNYRSFDLRLTISPGDQWAGTELRMKLTRGSFYNAALGGDTAASPIWPLAPELEFDTWVSGYTLTSAPTLAGRALAAAHGVNPIFSSDETNVTWLIPSPIPVFSDPQVVTAARLTVSRDAAGALVGRIGQTSTASNLPYMSYSFDPTSGFAPSSLGIISGWVFNDLARDQYVGPAPVPLQGRTIYIDANNNYQLDPGERSTTSDALGTYYFEGLQAGTYVVRQVLPAGWVASRSGSSATGYTVNLLPGHYTSFTSFGSYVYQRPRSLQPWGGGGAVTFSASGAESIVTALSGEGML